MEAAPGLGEAVVSGQVTGDLYRLDRESLALAEWELTGGLPILGDEQLADLARLALRLEAHFGCPQNVEFALASGRLYILQTRPITTLTAQPDRVPSLPKKLTPFQRVMMPLADERYPCAPKPLDNLLFVRLVSAGSTP